MTSEKEISPPSLAFKMQIANFIVDKFPRKESRKELSGENNREVTDVWEKLSQTRLGGEF